MQHSFDSLLIGNEWYSRNMYIKGSQENAHHFNTYGVLNQFGYKDFIPQFKAEKFDPHAWVDIFVEAGAKFAGPVAEHADDFSMWDSTLTPWNSVRMGPRRDVVGEMAVAVRLRMRLTLSTACCTARRLQRARFGLPTSPYLPMISAAGGY